MPKGKIAEAAQAIVLTTFALITVPLLVLNIFAGIVSGIWLLVAGRSREFALGLVILFIGSGVIGIGLAPGYGFQAYGAKLLQKGRTFGALVPLLLGCLWIYCVSAVIAFETD